MKLKVKKLNENAILPTKAHGDDIGFDLTAISMIVHDAKTHGYIEYKFGLSVQPEKGFGCYIYPRSSISKTGLWLANSVGVIDPNYTGELMVRFKWIPGTAKYEVGDKVAQLVIAPVIDTELELVNELEETDRGEGGFGSSGK